MQAATKFEFLTPVARLVQGHPMEKQTKDMQGAALTVKTGPNAGQPTQRYFVGVAIPKTDPGWPAFWSLVHQAARAGFPTLFDANGNCLARDFAFKVADGDRNTVDRPGDRPNNQKEGFPGHWVLKCSSSFPPKVFYAGRYQPHEQIQDPNVIKRGYYVRVAGTIEANGNQQKPGVYVNLSMVELVALGQEIVSGPDAAAVFGGAPAAALPPGATPLPAGGMPAAPAMPGNAGPAGSFAPPAAGFPTPPGASMPAPGGMPAMPGSPAMPAPGMAAPQAPATPVQPHPGILAGPGMTAPPAMGAPMAPAAPMAPVAPMAPQAPAATPTMARNPADGQTYAIAALQGNGWTVDSLRAAGWALM